MAKKRRQSLATALRHVSGLIRRAQQTDFTTRPEDTALTTLLAAVTSMYTFLQELGQDESICDCADRSWQGEGHDSQCHVERIAYLLSHLGEISSTSYYVVFVEGDVEPQLHGPFATETARDQAAKRLRAEDEEDLKSGIYRLDCTPAPRINAYAGGFFED